MTKFQENWLMSTLAPESIITNKIGNGFIHSIVNEDKTNRVFVLEVPNGMLLVNENKSNLLSSIPCYSFEEASNNICKLLKLNKIII